MRPACIGVYECVRAISLTRTDVLVRRFVEFRVNSMIEVIEL